MSIHKFCINQGLLFTPPRSYDGETFKSCQVIRLLATDGADPQYRVRCTAENFDRVVLESQLSQ
jgi:hypothetical protein